MPKTAEGSTGKEIALSVSCLSKRFPGVQALTDVSLDLHVGEVLGLVGENGAGKSTLIKIIAGVDSATQASLPCRPQLLPIHPLELP